MVGKSKFMANGKCFNPFNADFVSMNLLVHKSCLLKIFRELMNL